MTKKREALACLKQQKKVHKTVLPQPSLRLITAGEKSEPSPTGRGFYLKLTP